MPGPVESYLEAIAAHDWPLLAELCAKTLCGSGPYGDTCTGREPYAFLASLMPQLPAYSMELSRVTYADDGRRAFAELTETVTVAGKPILTPEVLVVDLDADGLVAFVSIYIRPGQR